MDDRAKLLELNRGTFLAETRGEVDGEPWDVWLRRVVTPSFQIRRANPATPNQDIEAMIKHVASDANPLARCVADERTWLVAGFGVVSCTVTLPGNPATFHNLKVFVRDEEGSWRCGYWMVRRA